MCLFSRVVIAAPAAPTLALTTSGLAVRAAWSQVVGATGYTLHFAPSPYTGPDSISSVDLGSGRELTVSLWEGAAFYVAITAYDGSGSSPYSNIGHFNLLTGGVDFSLLTSATNTVALPTASANMLKTNSAGQPAMLVYRTQNDGSQALEYWERNTAGAWAAEEIPGAGMSTSSSYWGYLTGEWAGLFFNSRGEPVVLNSLGAVFVKQSGQWRELNTSGSPRLGEQGTAAMGPNDTLHVLSLPSGSSGAITYSTLNLAETTWTSATIPVVADEGYFQMSSAPRFFSMAVGQDGTVHAVYTPDFYFVPVTGGMEVRSELWYLSNRNGGWETGKISGPASGSYGDAGLGASIALAPSGRPAVASVFIDRAATGSAAHATLMFHEQDGSGAWQSASIASASDGYLAGDGEMGTGFAPQLLFDAAGNPHIAFTDYASQHFVGSGQDDFGGNLRHAWKDGGVWRFNTVFRQTDPLRNQIYWPNMTFLGAGQVAFAGQLMADTLGADFSIQARTSAFLFVEETR